eukprot:TRINITY_DN6592_c0_g1_i3.p1 TRINITY_DN6592_c0_g1~~TRINITY_DN6592_c0_g1_i3.p1  ORF type:complete len:221 (-),score=38.74 TRINITY_DN6592_c0_g1_i3:46-708(-)
MQNNDDGPGVPFRIICVGDSGCGKTSIILRFTRDEYVDEYVDNRQTTSKSVVLPTSGRTVRADFDDALGRDHFNRRRPLVNGYYRRARAYIVVYDITDKASFDNIENWLREIDNYGGDGRLPGERLLLLGAKCDLLLEEEQQHRRVIPTEQARRLAQERNILFYEVSAKEALNVDEAIVALADRAYSFGRGAPPRPAAATAATVDLAPTTAESDRGCLLQ